ncbi:GNAT family N-acetyltransferase [Priestia aryabhattai]|uniref:GNAT family N-acetyltransferase n=1 Tax=Priestia aryabhattai TaxID=412384 RepID=UPI0015F6B853|nr:GNAT family N-acetyltransferase [Priestia aryabhattai]MBZ6484012.1 GNAT family N-acetyltransferase [Priestia aryabhattai]
MYLRKRIPYKDDSYLISLTMDNFRVKRTVVQNILKQSYEVLVICNNEDEVIGYLCYKLILKDVIFINYVVLDRPYQGQGVGGSFLPNAISYARKKGIRGVTGFVDNHNSEAYQIFRHWGFRPLVNIAGGTLIGVII